MWFYWLLIRGMCIALVWAIVHLIDEPTGENLIMLVGMIAFSCFIAVANGMEREAVKNEGKIYARFGSGYDDGKRD
ncbi:hypothetical protein RBD90_004482 [Salmonella enterica]|nr:hypothetical protein [Salmonella enterica]ELG7717155.1 hypothetical protein [Salmonella enterica]ELH0823308.1 hypothetical protein [Salmonella enterica]